LGGVNKVRKTTDMQDSILACRKNSEGKRGEAKTLVGQRKARKKQEERKDTKPASPKRKGAVKFSKRGRETPKFNVERNNGEKNQVKGPTTIEKK